MTEFEKPEVVRPLGRWPRVWITMRVWTLGWRHSILTLHLRGKWRRFWMIWLKPGYVKKSLARRRGHCLQCGTCCALGYACPMLHSGRLCMVYHGYRPHACVMFPIDERDLADVTAAGGKCGFSFESEEKKK